MPVRVRILLDGAELAGELDDSPEAAAIAAALPLEETARTFGKSYYIETPVELALGPEADDAVAVGDIAYWPAALAVAFFFGPTPESAPGSDEPVAASDVAIVGRFEDPGRLRELPVPSRIRIERA